MLYKFVKYRKYFIITTYSHCIFQSWGRREEKRENGWIYR